MQKKPSLQWAPHIFPLLNTACTLIHSPHMPVSPFLGMAEESQYGKLLSIPLLYRARQRISLSRIVKLGPSTDIKFTLMGGG